ncbi:MAG: sel1 repeat family protein [Duodenibacillus sp.]|nr:sel1 repeat family protein [Duodenibacillus sp.]
MPAPRTDKRPAYRTEPRFTVPERAAAMRADAILGLLEGRAQERPEPDAGRVSAWAREAALGSPDAQFELARALTSGQPLSADNRAAVKWLRKAAQQEHAASRHLLGVLIARAQGVRADPQQAVALFRAAAVMGCMQAQYDLARALTWGFGCEPCDREAMSWFRLAAAQGHVPSMAAAGRGYLEGRGCERDLRQAAQWFRKAALAGDPEAAFALSSLHRRSDYPQASGAEALRWCGEAARAGLAAAQYQLALAHWSGEGTPRSPRLALEWARRAAEQEEPRALIFLARCIMESPRADATAAMALAMRASACAKRGSDEAVKSAARLFEAELSALSTPSRTVAARMMDGDAPSARALVAAALGGLS